MWAEKEIKREGASEPQLHFSLGVHFSLFLALSLDENAAEKKRGNFPPSLAHLFPRLFFLSFSTSSRAMGAMLSCARPSAEGGAAKVRTFDEKNEEYRATCRRSISTLSCLPSFSLSLSLSLSLFLFTEITQPRSRARRSSLRGPWDLRRRGRLRRQRGAETARRWTGVVRPLARPRSAPRRPPPPTRPARGKTVC